MKNHTRGAHDTQDDGFEALHLDGMARHFGVVTALRDLTISIKRGEFIALLGPSGCGKSTALNCVAGLLPLTGGEIRLDQRRIDILPPEKRGFGMVFQNYALFPHMSVRKNIAFGLTMRRIPAAEARIRVEEALDLVQLRAHGDKLPGQLSGGQQQRVAIARAIVINPPLILMDEPLSNLDAKLRLEMRREIRRIHQEVRRATIYVTHDQDEALSLADRIVVMQDGGVLQIGTPETLYHRPATLDVARFMGFRNIVGFDVDGTVPGGPMVRLHRNGITLHATLEGETIPARVLAAIRPDDIRIGTGSNALEGRVTAVDYCGRDYHAEVETALGPLHARLEQAVKPGDDVRLVIAPDRVLAYPEGPAHPHLIAPAAA